MPAFKIETLKAVEEILKCSRYNVLIELLLRLTLTQEEQSKIKSRLLDTKKA